MSEPNLDDLLRAARTGDRTVAAPLIRLLGAHPEHVLPTLRAWCGHDRRGDLLGYVATIRFELGLLGRPGDPSGTGRMAQALIDAGAPVDGEPGARETPLITAASYGDAEVAAVLIAAGAEVDALSAPNSGGAPSNTALGHAAIYGMTDVLDLLVAAGARIDSLERAAAAGDISRWPLHRFTMQSRLRALVFAADHQRLDVLGQLVEAGTPVNEADAEWQRMPLHVAAQHGRPASVRWLLAHGADPELRDPDRHRTPLEWCQPANRYLDRPDHDEVEAILRSVFG